MMDMEVVCPVNLLLVINVWWLGIDDNIDDFYSQRYEFSSIFYALSYVKEKN